MELTHRLKVAHIEWHTETKIELLDPYHFRYVLRSEYDQYQDSTEWVLTTTSNYLDQGRLKDLTFSPPYEYEIIRNISRALYIPSGRYIVKTLRENSYLRLYKLNGNEQTNQLAILVGEYEDGDIITLADSALYIIADDDMHSVGNLSNYLSSFREVEVQVPTKVYETSVIEEPIGFDDLQSTIKRHDYHGMGAEVSLGNLEFYNEAFGIIQDAYDADIDTEVVYEVLAGSEVIYSGQLDLSTYNEKRGDYQGVQVKVGEIGAKTTFNNRTDKEVDVDDPKTIDGSLMDHPDWNLLRIPMKHLLYTNAAKVDQDTQVDARFNKQYVMLPIGTEVVNEFGSLSLTNSAVVVDNTAYLSPQYEKSSDHTIKYGSNTKLRIQIKYKILAAVLGQQAPSFRYRLCAKDESGNIIRSDEVEVPTLYDGNLFRMDVELDGELNAGENVLFYFDIGGNGQGWYRLTLQKGTFVKMTMYDNLEEVVNEADTILVHDALNVVSHAISENELSVKSDWYRTPESHWEAGAIRTDANGGSGALKALTNGYKIRGLFSDGETKRNMPLSFKALIESLDALDCIGWGFSKENGELCVRVERWDWFYQDNVILTLANAAEVTTEVYTDRIPTELKIGYKKFATQDQYNSIDSPHGMRTFINGIKALTKTYTKESEFIADNYAIEETRRARTQVNETEETSYDESIFVFELLRKKSNGEYTIGHTATNAVNVGRAEEFINAKLTPRHMAARWRDFIFTTNNSTPFRFTSGEINYQSQFGVLASEPTIDSEEYNSLTSMAATDPQVENADMAHLPAKFKAEKITFSYPLSIAEYKTVLANPYGLVSVNGTLGWIMDFKYSFHDGTADFTLLAKYVTQ